MVEGITIVIDNKTMSLDKFKDNLNAAGRYFNEAVKPESPVLNAFLEKKIKPILKKSVNSRFRAGRDLDGKAYHSLSEFRQKQRLAKGTGIKPLSDTGRLRNGIRYTVTKGTLRAISSSPYAWVHQPPEREVSVERGIRGIRKAPWTVGGLAPEVVESALLAEFSRDTNVKKPFTEFKSAFIPERTFLGFTAKANKSTDIQINKLIKNIVENFLGGLARKVERGTKLGV